MYWDHCLVCTVHGNLIVKLLVVSVLHGVGQTATTGVCCCVSTRAASGCHSGRSVVCGV